MNRITHVRNARWLVVVTFGAAVACGGGGDSPSAQSPDPVISLDEDGGRLPTIDPADFVAAIDNPYLPFTPGARWVYEGDVDGEHERIEVTVTADRHVVLGISAVVVSDINYVDGALVAQTFDWYAQDRAGNVWYLGEDTEEYEDGKLVGTEGSWEAGVDGAVPGIFMLAEPTVGDAYRQHGVDEAEELAEVLDLGATRSIGVGDYRDVLVVREWSASEPEVVEEKSYAPGVGKVYETHTAGGEGGTELVEFTPGP
jgi:hypothetical protein